MDKIFLFDLETTGLDKKRHAIHQISGKVIIDDVVKESFDFKVRPWEGCEFEPKALEVGGVTQEQLMQYPPMMDVYKELIALLDKYVDKYNKADKFFMMGYNIAGFDCDFLREFFIMCGNKFFGSYFWSVPLDVMVLAQAKLIKERPTMPDFKQGTVAKQLGVVIEEDKLHDASYDTWACYEIYKRLV